jgi:phenylpyruvate tautomerase PptA (4-oxalocrotonate tautomerase family)
MPCLEISIPKLDINIKKALTEKLTQALAESFELPKEFFGIRYFEFGPGESANEGILWDGNNVKPYHHFVLHIGAIDNIKKKKAIAALTSAYIQTVNHPDWTPVIFINEITYDNIGVEGRPLAERE